MEVKARIKHEGNTADYSVVEIDCGMFHAFLEGYQGEPNNCPPLKIMFVYAKDHTMANSDVISIAQKLVSEMTSKAALDSQFRQGS